MFFKMIEVIINIIKKKKMIYQAIWLSNQKLYFLARHSKSKILLN